MPSHTNVATGREGRRPPRAPSFLPWQREFVRLFEVALPASSGTQLAITYWDWTGTDNPGPTTSWAATAGRTTTG
ncbi:tyrosinase family protein [Streptomyces sp. NPDC013489]|uniref:tyrosinase family protein n=1 Tax=Streptomyces sp. NPDC013489 TaxID=3155606 RepID=UPI0033DC8806